MKNVHRVSTKQHGDIKLGISQSKNSTFLQAQCASALSCSNMWKSNYPHKHVNAIALHVLVAATVKLQEFVINEPGFLPSEQGSNWQHQLKLASLYPWHIMTSALRHDQERIFKQLPHFVEIFWISISSATTVKNFMKIGYYLSELWKKEKGVVFYETPCIVS